ncbi:MAG TPA: cytochrome c [Vicinamibacterales bacterium]|nr:cytochrome c [Vicinamibacterales bacterium]
MKHGIIGRHWFSAPLLVLVLAPAPSAQTPSSAAPRRAAQPAAPARLGIGRPATPAEIAALDDDVMPDGTGLPPGSGTAAAGAPLFAARCAACHGKTGREGPNDVLVGAAPKQGFPFSQDPSLPHTIGNYWPYATTVLDYIRRAMPPDAPGSLSDGDVYNLTAFLLHANDLIAADAVVDATTLPKVEMPARSHFVVDQRRR